MLRQSFIHVPGIGPAAERSLWEQGCADWDAYLAEPDRFSLGSARIDHVGTFLELSRDALAEREHQFFARHLGLAESWRAWPDFKDTAVYLDIETDGGNSGDAITMIGLYDSTGFQCLTRDEGLGAFPDIMSRYSMVVTFFGASFDLPMIQKKFTGFRFDQLHLDLCPTLKRVGFKGGLKKIEKAVGIARPDEAEGLNGRDAIRLWRQYERYGDIGAKETLIAYNREDVVNLETLAQIAYDRLKDDAYGVKPVATV